MPDSQERFKNMESTRRRLRRSNRAHRLVAAVAVALVVVMALDRAAIKRDYRNTVVTYRAAVYGVTYALTSEQAKAGQFESERNDRKATLDKARSYVGGLRYKVGKLEQALKQCDATNSMITDDGWTGNADIKPGDK